MNKESIIKICEEHNLGSYISHASIGQGENHHNILFETDTNKLVLRYGLKNSKNIKKEFERMKEIPDGFAPKVFAHGYIKNQEYSIQEFIDGSPLHPDDSTLKKFIETIAKFHSLTKNDIKQTINMHHKFLHEIKEFKEQFPSVNTPTVFIDEILKWIQSKNIYFTDVPKQLVHQDLILRNCINKDGKIVFIDWEWIDYTDPARDIASFYFVGVGKTTWQTFISEEKEAELLDIYCNHTYQDKNVLLQRIRVWQVFVGLLDILFFSAKLADWKLNSGEETKDDYKQAIADNTKAIQHIIRTN